MRNNNKFAQKFLITFCFVTTIIIIIITLFNDILIYEIKKSGN